MNLLVHFLIYGRSRCFEVSKSHSPLCAHKEQFKNKIKTEVVRKIKNTKFTASYEKEREFLFMEN